MVKNISTLPSAEMNRKVYPSTLFCVYLFLVSAGRRIKLIKF